MGHRLSKIYTRTGDSGTTGLGDGSRVTKDDVRIEALGAVDELNSSIGVALCQTMPSEIRATLSICQHHLFDLGGELCIPGREVLDASHASNLEVALDKLNEELSPLKEFILPGGDAAAAALHLARTVCRRAERRVISLGRDSQVSPASATYLNRLSDYLFVAARYANHAAGQPDVLWQPAQKR